MGFYNGLRINMSKIKFMCYLTCFQGWHRIQDDKSSHIVEIALVQKHTFKLYK